MTGVLTCSGLTAGYGELAVVRDIDFELDSGRVLAVLGPDGAGKTTLLSTIAGLLPRLAGEAADSVTSGSRDLRVENYRPGTEAGRLATASTGLRSCCSLRMS